MKDDYETCVEQEKKYTLGEWKVADYTTINSGARPVLCEREHSPVVASVGIYPYEDDYDAAIAKAETTP